jgi:hypothetical protein
LINDYHYSLILKEQNKQFVGQYFVVFKNDIAKKQLEFSVDSTFFHCEIRRISDGNVAEYNDELNCIGFEKLARAIYKDDYNHFEYYAGGTLHLDGVMKNVVRLFYDAKEYLTKDIWLNKNDYAEKIHYKDDKKPLEVLLKEEIRNRLIKELTLRGYDIVFDNDKLGPHIRASRIFKIILNGKDTIEISNKDWRDYVEYIHIYKDSKKILSIDTKQYQDVAKPYNLIMKVLMP